MKHLLRFPLLVVAVLMFLVLPGAVKFYTDWLWFQEVGFQSVFMRDLTGRSMVWIVVFGLTYLVLFGNLRIALGSLQQPYLLFGPTTAQIRPMVVDRGQIRSIVLMGAALVAFVIGLATSAEWLTFMRAARATPFGEVDPVLGRDMAFYVFHLPSLELLRGLLMLVLGLAFAGSAGLYGLAGALSYVPARGLVVRPAARRHLATLAAVLFLVLAFDAWLDMAGLLLARGDVIHGAAYTDVAARLPALRLLAGAAVVAAGLAVWHAFSTRSWPILAAVGIYFLVVAGGALYAGFVQRFVVAPNEQARQTPYIVNNIAATRRAFALDAIEERELSGDATLTRNDIEANADTLENVRLWDHQPLLETFGQIQEIRTYYDFVAADNDRYEIDGKLRQIMLSARELNPESLPNRTWINERLVFTHGYGLALGPVNAVEQEGLPVLFLKNIPPESSTDLEVTEPSIYFGELASEYVFVKTRAQEFHYPKGEDNVYTEYQGTGGVPVGGLVRKLLFSLRFRSFRIFLNDDLTSESRVLYYRNIMERIRTIAPFLQFDPDPYLVTSGGKLFWICDAYTITDRYPYSTAVARGINYIRNSVKVVIDAYNGTTTFYLAEPGDPLVLTLQKVFPGLLTPLQEMPEDLRRHVRYPEGIFDLQTAVFSTYHMTNPAVFYNKEDQWEVPSIEAEGNATPLQPYYTIMRLPGEANAEFIQMLPFTPRRKDNLAAWMVARSDGDRYGRLLVFQFPKQKVVFGPRQIVGRINQDQVISPQITLWNQQGSQVIWGTLLVIPIEESLLYVRPLYLRAAGGRIPELKRVIVGHQNQIVMAETLELALDRIFGTGGAPSRAEEAAALVAPRPTEEAPGPATDLVATAKDHYDRAVQALRAGNWAEYGEQIRLLGEVLNRLSRRQEP
jgi:uncharacterized membrane protein (UPF0182 family)